MKLLVQPGDNVMTLLKGIEGARKTVQVAIFRCDSKEIEQALKDAVKRGVAVHALIAHTNRGGEVNLRKLEMRLLEYGVTVVRTGNDMARYHDKLLIVDRQQLFLMAFNFTRLDLERSRSFAIVTRNRKLVEEALKLYEADSTHHPYDVKAQNLVVSPLNARRRLADFICKARKRLLIYDPKISDHAMIELLQERARAGVEIRIIGKVTHNRQTLEVRRLRHLHLHTRTIIRDESAAFIGSQSLRKAELDARREVGIIFQDRKVANRLARIFQGDWAASEQDKGDEKRPGETAQNTSKLVGKKVAEELPPVAPVVESALQEIAGVKVNGSLDLRHVENSVKGAVREAVEEIIEQEVKGLIEAKSTAGRT